MNVVNRLRRTRRVAIKNFDEELYKLVKTFASLEDRSIVSIFEEAIRQWIEGRYDLKEVQLWTMLEQSYEENIRVLKDNSEALKKYGSGYAVICDKKFVGVFNSYEEALESIRRECRLHTLVIKLPYREEVRELEIGLPW